MMNYDDRLARARELRDFFEMMGFCEDIVVCIDGDRVNLFFYTEFLGERLEVMRAEYEDDLSFIEEVKEQFEGLNFQAEHLERFIKNEWEDKGFNHVEKINAFFFMKKEAFMIYRKIKALLEF